MVSRERMEALAGASDRLDAMMAGQTVITAEVAQVLHEYSGLPMGYLMADPSPPHQIDTPHQPVNGCPIVANGAAVSISASVNALSGHRRVI